MFSAGLQTWNSCLSLLSCVLTTAMSFQLAVANAVMACSHLFKMVLQMIFCPATLCCPRCISLLTSYMSYTSWFLNSHTSFSLSSHTISLMHKCQHQPPSSSSCYIFQKTPLVPFLLSSCLVEAFWEHPLFSISCLQIQVLTKCVTTGGILIGWDYWLLVTICDIALLFRCSSHLSLSIYCPLS